MCSSLQSTPDWLNPWTRHSKPREGRRSRLKDLQTKEAERALRYQVSKLQQYSTTVTNKTRPRERAATCPSPSPQRQTSSHELFHHPGVLQHMDSWQLPADRGPTEDFSPVSTKPGTRPASRLDSPMSSFVGSPAFATACWLYVPSTTLYHPHAPQHTRNLDCPS